MSFEKEPFDAGVDTNEDEDPKKFIQQLSGKLGQSLRKYATDQGQPDFELEKFAINSVISATNTAEMSDDDKQDIIKKIETSGAGETNGTNNTNDNDNTSDQEVDSFGGDLNANENINIFESKNYINNIKLDEMINELLDTPLVKPNVIPKTKPSRKSKPFKVPIIKPEYSPKPKALN